MMVYHNAKNTVSDLINHGVNINNGSLTFNVSSFVPKNNSGCVVDQNNRIINLTDNELNNVTITRKYLDYIYKTENLVRPYYSK